METNTYKNPSICNHFFKEDNRIQLSSLHLEKIQKIENYPMESILSFDKDKDKTKDLFQDIYRSEKIIITIMYFV